MHSTGGARRAETARPSDAALAPQAEAAEKGEVVVAEPRTLRHFLELACVAAAKHDIVGFQYRLQGLDHLLDGAAPFLGAQAAAAAVPDIVFVGAALLIIHVAEFHRLDDPVDDHGRP